MGLLDTVTSKLGDKVVQEQLTNQAQSFLGGKKEESKEGEEKKEGEQSEDKKHQYVDKLESIVGSDTISQIENKVGKGNFEKGEDFLEDQLQKKFGGQQQQQQ